MTEMTILEQLLTNGVFASLFAGLLFYVLKDSKKREEKYRGIIESLTNYLSIVREIKTEVHDIKKAIKDKITKKTDTEKVQ